ncbi:MAG: rhodanese-like domain-containing protein [Acidobacteriota bacterium]
MFFRQILDPHLAQYAYLIGCQASGEALILDPQRDVDRYVDLAAAEGLRLVAAAETHIHADFLSGTRELAEGHGARLYLSAEGGEAWTPRWVDPQRHDVTWLRDGDSFFLGKLEIRALHTPGHTPEHLSFLIIDHGGPSSDDAERPALGLASGDFLFVGDLGRPDLLETAAGERGAMEPAARDLFASVERLQALPDHLQIWPGHGAGSACGKALGAVPISTLGYERQVNPALLDAQSGQSTFVRNILQGQPEPPLYFARMKQLNRDDIPLLGELPNPPRLGTTELAAAAQDDEAVILDARQDRQAFLRGHLPGALHTPWGKSFSTLVGSLVDPQRSLVLLIDDAHRESAIRDLVRIGYDRIVGWSPLGAIAIESTSESGQRSLQPLVSADFAALQRALGQNQKAGEDPAGGPDFEATVLDVRSAAEFSEGHLPGALNIAHTRLAAHGDELPPGPLWVHCRSGARATAAASWLAQRGREVTLVDDHFDSWRGPLAGDG